MITCAIFMNNSGLAAQNQLNFGRNAEREADRLGLKILLQSGFEPKGMINFFGGLPKPAPSLPLVTNDIHYRELLITGIEG